MNALFKEGKRYTEEGFNLKHSWSWMGSGSSLQFLVDQYKWVFILLPKRQNIRQISAVTAKEFVHCQINLATLNHFLQTLILGFACHEQPPQHKGPGSKQSHILLYFEPTCS